MFNLVPAHVRQTQITDLHQFYFTGDDAQTLNVCFTIHAFFGCLSQHLHTQAEAQQWLFRFTDKVNQITFLQIAHCRFGRTHTRQDQLIGRFDVSCIATDNRFNAQALNCHFYR
eukprot:RCo014543